MAQTKADYIYNRITEGEHQQQDFKFEISDARKIAKSLSAFSNTDGGRLLVGVKDNGKIAGVRSEEEIYMIEAAAKLYCKPQINCEMHVHTVERRTVLEVIVPQGEQKPYYAKDHNNRWWAYIRVRDENILATPVHIKVWQQAECPKEHLYITRKLNRSYWYLAFTRHDHAESILPSGKNTTPQSRKHTSQVYPFRPHRTVLQRATFFVQAERKKFIIFIHP